MKKTLSAPAARAGDAVDRVRAGAHQPAIGPRRLQHSQGDGEADGELKAQIDEIDKQIAEATRLGKNAEFRRLMAKGTTLLAGRPWTDVLDYTNSVVLRTDHIVADSTKPYPVRLEQIYSPSIELTRSLTAHVSVRQRPVPATGRSAARAGRSREGSRNVRRRVARSARVTLCL